MKCTQYGMCSQVAFKNARVMFFSKLGGKGSNFRSGSQISLEGCPNANLTPPKVRAGVDIVRLFLLITFLCDIKIDMSNSITCLNQTPIYKCYVVRCGSKSRYQQNKCLNVIGLHVQSVISILGLIVHIIGRIYMTT